MESHAWFSLFSYYFVLLFYYDRILFGKALIDTTLYLVIYQGLIFFVLFFLRTSEINLFYNLQVFYWHFLEILWLFIFLILYLWYLNIK